MKESWDTKTPGAVCACIHVCMRVCMRVCVHGCVHMCVHACVHVCAFAFAYMSVLRYIHVIPLDVINLMFYVFLTYRLSLMHF